MAKRLSETEIWKEQWHRELPLEYKCFWKYLCDNCDLSGVWAKDTGLASFQIGREIQESNALELFNKDKKRIVVMDGGSKWFIPQFIHFQYGELQDSSPIHKKVIGMLKKQGLFDTLSIGYGKGRHTLQDKEEDKDKDKDKGGMGGFKRPALEEVEAYCKERNNNIDANQFINHYQANGWIRGKSRIKDWKACVRTWEQNNKQSKAAGWHEEGGKL